MEKKKLPAGVRVLLGFVSVLLCLLLTLSSMATIAIADVQIITSKDNLQKIISQALFTPASLRPIPRLAAGAALTSPSARTGEASLQDAVVDALYDLIVGQSGNSMGVTREQVSELLEKSTVSDFLSEKIAGIIADVYTGESTTTLTKSEVETLLKENADVIEEVFHTTVDQQKIDYVSSYVEKHNVIGTVQAQVNNALGIGSGSQPTPSTQPDAPTAGTDTSSPSTNSSSPAADSTVPSNGSETLPGATVPDSGSTPMNPVASVLNVLRTYTSTKALIAALVSCVVLAGLLFLSNWGKPFSAMKGIAVSLLLGSLPFVIATAVSSVIPDMLAGFTDMASVIGNIILAVLRITLPVNLGVFVFSIVLLIAGIVLGHTAKKKAQRV